MNAADMINESFRHQNPEVYGREAVGQIVIPADLRSMTTEAIPVTPELPLDPMGDPEAVPLPFLGDIAIARTPPAAP